jgi:predicted PurR-regulated permease PerM
MEFGEKDLKKIFIIIILAIIAILSYLIVKPVFYAVFGGLILAYILSPIYHRITLIIRNRTSSAFILLFLVLVVLVIPLWFIAPLVIEQVFELFKQSQTLEVQKFVAAIFPTSSIQFTSQLTVTINTIISKVSSSALNSLVDLFLEMPTIAINLFLAAFVFFYALRDSDKLIKFVSGISPINKDKQKLIIDQFKGITDSILYGLFIVGIIQGILTGLGLLLFGVENALVLTLIATFLSVIPFLGPYLVWVPVSVFLFSEGNVPLAIGYLVYNITVVSTLDNLLRSYIVSRKTNISPAIVLTGMFGGIAIFGIAGILIGPLILAYFITFLRSYKDKNLYSLFSDESIKKD